jgi:hypothetical protein
VITSLHANQNRLRALYGHDNAITDFLAERCNERSAALFGLSKDKAAGKQLFD